MDIHIKQISGFAGALDLGHLDTAGVDAEAARRIEQLVSRLGFFSSRVGGQSGGIGADLPGYEITVTDGGVSDKAVLRDEGGSESTALRELVETISSLGGR